MNFSFSTFLFPAFVTGLTWGALYSIAGLLTNGLFSQRFDKQLSRIQRYGIFFIGLMLTNHVFIPLLESSNPYKYAYLFFYFALAVTMLTDSITFLISRFVTIYLVPVGWALSYCGYLPISPLESILGSIIGLGLLAGVNFLCKRFLGRDGLGQGDIDLMAFIGAFTGPVGCWFTLMIGSIAGSVCGLIYMAIFKRTRNDFLLPFGFFLAGSAIIYVMFQETLTTYFLPGF